MQRDLYDQYLSTFGEQLSVGTDGLPRVGTKIDFFGTGNVAEVVAIEPMYPGPGLGRHGPLGVKMRITRTGSDRVETNHATIDDWWRYETDAKAVLS